VWRWPLDLEMAEHPPDAVALTISRLLALLLRLATAILQESLGKLTLGSTRFLCRVRGSAICGSLPWSLGSEDSALVFSCI
jgi:hypothetical protein